MTLFNKEQLEEILASGDFNKLEGKYENEWFDCKKEPYQLDIEKDKHELVKDVSSFANEDGGFILIGAKTQGDEYHSGERIKEISTFSESLVNVEQNQKIIEAGIYPSVEGLNISWYRSKDDATKGLVLIKIPSQQNSDKPFLTKKVLNGNRILETSFGLFQRKGDVTSHYDFKDLHRLIQQGQQYEKNMQTRFDVIESMLQEITVPSANQEDHKKKIDLRKEQLLTRNQQEEARYLTLTGFVEGKTQVKNLNFSDELKELSSNYTVPLRDGGWKLLYSATQTINSPELVEFGYESNSLSLYSDGMAVYFRKLDQISLVNNLSSIIPIALIETVYQFAEFYRNFVNNFQSNALRIIIGIELNNLSSTGVKTNLSYDLRPGFFFDPYVSPQNELNIFLSVEKEFRAERLAFQILKTIYEWFGIERNPPYTKVGDGGEIIDIQEITRL